VSTTPPVAEHVVAEQSLLGAALQDAATTLAACRDAGLKPQHLADPDHACILATVMQLLERGEAVDVVSVHLAMAAEAKQRIGLAYLNQLAQSVPSAAAVSTFVRHVLQHAAKRERLTLLRAALAQEQASGASDEAASAYVAELLQRLRDAMPKSKASTLPLQWARDLGEQPRMAPQLVEGLLQVGKVSCVMGAPGAAKTYFSAALAMAVAAGREFMGRRTRQGCWVLYLAAEGASSVLGRLQADAKHYGREHGRLAVVTQSLDLLEPSADIDALAATARHVGAAAGGGDGLIVIDTVARVTPGADENSGQDMGRFIAALDRLCATTGAHVLVVHHIGKDATRGARGHSSLKAALDTEILVTLDDANKVRRVKVTKQRDLASEGDEFAFKLIPVELGQDEWGNPVTSCVVEPSEVGIGKPAPKRMTASQGAVMAFLAGRAEGARRAAIVAGLEAQGVARSAVYKAVGDLLVAGLLMDVGGVIYSPKG